MSIFTQQKSNYRNTPLDIWKQKTKRSVNKKNTTNPPWCVKTQNHPSVKNPTPRAGPSPSTALEPLTLPPTIAPFVSVVKVFLLIGKNSDVESGKVFASRSYYHNFKEQKQKTSPGCRNSEAKTSMWRKWQNLKTLDTKGCCKNLNFEIESQPSWCNFAEMSQPVFRSYFGNVHTVDGKNPAPVDRYNIVYRIIYRVLYIPPRWCRISSINSMSSQEMLVQMQGF